MTRDRGRYHRAVWLLPACLLVVAILPMPYGYYQVLRLVVCSVAVFLTAFEFRQNSKFGGWCVVLSTVALLFNPIVPVHLSQALWMPIDLLTACVFLSHWWTKSLRGVAEGGQ
ncbi:DUF6804 family protein [Ruegeria sp. MALMAid1280]|uniref:DUF6804 family protein n=1 Tax=Ruegeria sp. MALMAid1280 TaxID=3411634 RepID=UPI003BA37928